MSSQLSLLVILIIFLATLALTAVVRKFLLARALLDHPNARSSHKVPVPRGGGWAILSALLPCMIISSYVHGDLAQHAGVIAGILVLAFISWRDDKKGSSPIMRLSLHILAASLGSLVFSPEQTLFNGMLPFWLDRAVMIIGWAWFINLYNFMDGIDGITCTETIAIATGVCVVLAAANIADPFVNSLSLMLTGVSLGFLAFNWHPAKIFMGDVGSIPLGYLTGFILLVLAVNGQPLPAFILPLYYLADSGITITKRALRGEKIWQAHRQHFYQRAALGLGRHDKVVFIIALSNIALIMTAILAVTAPLPGAICAMLVVTALLRYLSAKV